MTVATILVDSREQKPYEFADYPVETREETLRTADYTLPRFCEYDAENDTYVPWLGVERKSGPDLLQSITHGRDRFKNEIKRADGWPDNLRVMIETDRLIFENNEDFMQYRDVQPNQVLGTLDAWDRYYDVEFIFAGSRQMAEQRTHDLLLTWLRAYE